jgi:L-asparaginase
MKKKILTVFTGGTICTTLKNGKMSTDPTAATALIELYEQSDSFCKNQVDLIPGKQFQILSENMTVEKWNELIDYFQQILPTLSDYSGIIIAHGTDTLAYTAALFSQLFKGIDIPVLFVSSNHPILTPEGKENPIANGNANFKAAVECIYTGLQPGVYTTYRNPQDSITYLHKGEHLLQCRIYDDNFYSRDMKDLADLPIKQPSLPLRYDHLPIMRMGEARLTDCVLKINPYIGLNYKMLNPSRAKAVLHGTYHSGTACVVRTEHQPDYRRSNNSILGFFDRCAKKNVPFYYAPAHTGEQHHVYSSVPFIEEHQAHGQKIRFLYGMTEELMYAKLVLAYSLNLSDGEIEKFLSEE